MNKKSVPQVEDYVVVSDTPAYDDRITTADVVTDLVGVYQQYPLDIKVQKLDNKTFTIEYVDGSKFEILVRRS